MADLHNAPFWEPRLIYSLFIRSIHGGDGAIDDIRIRGRGNAAVNVHRCLAGLASSLALLNSDLRLVI